MEGGSAASGYYAIRMKSDVLTEVEYGGTRTQEKYCVEPGTYFGLVLLLSTRTGEPLAILNDGVLQHMRVGADSAIGTKYAARDDARVLGMLGSGGMARSHLEALLTVRPLERGVQPDEGQPGPPPRCASSTASRWWPSTSHGGVPGCRHRLRLRTPPPPTSSGTGRPGTHVTSICGSLDARAREVLDAWLRLGTAPAPVNDPSWRPTDEYLAYVARPQDPVWAHHRHKGVGRRRRARAWSAWRTCCPVPRRCARRRRHHVLRAGNIQGAQFFAVAGLVYELARERDWVGSCRRPGSCRTSGTDRRAWG